VVFVEERVEAGGRWIEGGTGSVGRISSYIVFWMKKERYYIRVYIPAPDAAIDCLAELR
jgi:hypothetical protein